jgi:hypothetical protein
MKISSKHIDACLILLIFTLFAVPVIRAETLSVGVITDGQSDRMVDLLARTQKESKKDKVDQIRLYFHQNTIKPPILTIKLRLTLLKLFLLIPMST